MFEPGFWSKLVSPRLLSDLQGGPAGRSLWTLLRVLDVLEALVPRLSARRNGVRATACFIATHQR